MDAESVIEISDGEVTDPDVYYRSMSDSEIDPDEDEQTSRNRRYAEIHTRLMALRAWNNTMIGEFMRSRGWVDDEEEM